MSKQLKVALFPEASFGAALNCVGIAQELRRMGADPVFICYAGFTGVFSEYGFKEYHLPNTNQNNSGTIEDYWQTFTNTHLPHFKLDPKAQLETYVAPTWSSIVETVEEAEEGLKIIIDRIKPDLILLDNVIMFPAIANANCPWVRVISCAETELPDANVPPYLSGLSTDDPTRKEFEAAFKKATQATHKHYNNFRKKHGLPALKAGIFLEPSPTLNLLLSPTVVRYQRKQKLDTKKFVCLEGCVREESHYRPPSFPDDNGPLIYVSFGSLGAIDTDLIGRLIKAFSSYPARFIVNVGALIDSYENIPDNVYLGSWFPQPSVVAQADLFIHHGGNNSFCEALYFGVPSLIMPYCWDGHDNAQRAQECGVGLNINRTKWTAASLRKNLDQLLSDKEQQSRLKDIATEMQKTPGTKQAAQAILALSE